MATILIVEDEALIAAEIARALVRLGHVPLEPVDNSEEALDTLAHQSVELVLMDINIAGDCDGIATALLVRRQFALPVVFLTARSDPGTLDRAKLAQPYGFLLKPFTDDSLRAIIEFALYNAYQVTPIRSSAATALDVANAGTVTQSAQNIFIRNDRLGTGHFALPVKEILYLESMQNYVRLHTAKESYMVHSTLKELEQKLPGHFLRTHRSYVVNLNHVEAYTDGCVQLGKHNLAVSRSYMDELKKRLHFIG